MHSFCTLFDSNYLTRALAMYHSLDDTGDDFVLYAVCFDDLAYQILLKLNLPKLVLIPLAEFESPELRAVKGQRTAGEYCWTCTPHVIRYALDTYHLPAVTYLDADLFFYEKPSLLLNEFEKSKGSVLITSHRYTPQYDQSETSGIYCVQFMTFKADHRGLTVLQWWQERCIEWCYNRFEDGKFGDQKYLDDWLDRFEGVHALSHLGGGVAPWNIQQYRLSERGGKLYVNDFPLVFYHFHGYKQYSDNLHDLGGYQLSNTVVNLVYRPYLRSLALQELGVKSIWPDFDRGRAMRVRSWKTPLRNIRRRLKGEFNEYRFL